VCACVVMCLFLLPIGQPPLRGRPPIMINIVSAHFVPILARRASYLGISHSQDCQLAFLPNDILPISHQVADAPWSL
jgi:hypothetical protein